MRLLLTRPLSDEDPLTQEVRELGHEPVLQPLLDFRLLDFSSALFSDADVLVFTSGNAIRALKARGLISGAAHVPLFCAGPETARRALAAGFRTITGIAPTAVSLAAKIAARAPANARIAHITGAHQAFDLTGRLSEKGFAAQAVYTYAMEARAAFEPEVAAGIADGQIGGVILMSPRTAETFVALCHGHGLILRARYLRYLCLAESVACKLKPLAPAQVDVASEPGRKALLGLVAALPRPGQDEETLER
jgi:uroporphyrinogen-III synthase